MRYEIKKANPPPRRNAPVRFHHSSRWSSPISFWYPRQRSTWILRLSSARLRAWRASSRVFTISAHSRVVLVTFLFPGSSAAFFLLRLYFSILESPDSSLYVLFIFVCSFLETATTVGCHFFARGWCGAFTADIGVKGLEDNRLHRSTESRGPKYSRCDQWNRLASIPCIYFRVRVDHTVNPAWVGDLITSLM